MHRISRRVSNGRGHENDQVPFLGGGRFAPEEPPEQRKVSEKRDFVFDFLDVFRNQTAKHNRLTVPNRNRSDHLAQPEFRQWRGGGENGGGVASRTLNLCDKRAWIIVAQKLFDRRDDGHLN